MAKVSDIAILKDRKSPEEIEKQLLSGKLGNIRLNKDGYQSIGNYRLSHLIIEIHEPRFIEWMRKYQWRWVVHHIDGNRLNNIYSNLQVMKRSEHSRMHDIEYYANSANVEAIKAAGKKCSKTKTEFKDDPKNIEIVNARNEAISKRQKAYYADKNNAEDIKARNKAISEAKIAYYTVLVNREADSKTTGKFWNDSNNKTINKARSRAISRTRRKNWPTLETLEKTFTIKDYAKASKVSIDRAGQRLNVLFRESKITCEKGLIDGHWYNIYRRM